MKKISKFKLLNEIMKMTIKYLTRFKINLIKKKSFIEKMCGIVLKHQELIFKKWIA